MTFINEGNLFRLITGSRKKEAKLFTDWVCDVVLPSLSKKGYYIMENGFNYEELIKELEEKHDKRIKKLEKNVNILNERFENLDTSIDSYYAKIRDYSKECCKGVNLKMAKYLGSIATQTSLERNVDITSTHHEKYGTINMYRRDILQYVFDCYYEDAYIKFGDLVYDDSDAEDFYNEF